MPIYELKTLADQLDQTLLTERLIALLSAGFGMLATLLAAVGLYGVMAFVVARRTKELGVRIALGAQPGQVIEPLAQRGQRHRRRGLVVLVAVAAGEVAAAGHHHVRHQRPIGIGEGGHYGEQRAAVGGEGAGAAVEALGEGGLGHAR